MFFFLLVHVSFAKIQIFVLNYLISTYPLCVLSYFYNVLFLALLL